MYGLPETPRIIKGAFDRVGHGKATKNDYKLLESHIEEKKREIRIVKHELGIDGLSGAAPPKDYKPLSDIMRSLDGGRR